ncbi:UNVERIFIED_CONTAM: hypothetical protein FKN15_060235 [Acipenser sinensis]
MSPTPLSKPGGESPGNLGKDTDRLSRTRSTELTVPWEDAVDEAYERKKLWYAQLAAEAEQRDWRDQVYPVEGEEELSHVRKKKKGRSGCAQRRPENEELLSCVPEREELLSCVQKREDLLPSPAPRRGEPESPVPKRPQPKREGDYMMLPPPPPEGDYLSLPPSTLEGDYMTLLPLPPEGVYPLLLPPPLVGEAPLSPVREGEVPKHGVGTLLTALQGTNGASRAVPVSEMQSGPCFPVSS